MTPRIAAKTMVCPFVQLPFLALMLALLMTATVALADNVRGAWSPVYNWPLIPVHAVLMPDKRLLTYGTDGGGKQTGYFIYDVWDTTAGMSAGHLTLPNLTLTDIFCSSQVVLPQGGSVFIAGGDNWNGTATTNTGNRNSNLFDYGNDTLTRNGDMKRSRWYSSSTTLINGEVYIQGGSGGTDRPEIRGLNGVFRLLNGANTSSYDFMFPRNFVAPDGRVFGYDSNGLMYYVNTAGSGSVTGVGQFTGPTGDDASAVMFRPGRILQMGGNSNGAVVIDINGPSPTVVPTQSMSTMRKLVNATLLPDGKVVATGGSTVWNAMTGVNYTAEIWDPNTGQWTVGASANRARLYHSLSLLLPDASVLVGGGGAPGPQNNTNVEIYTPPYLFDASGGLAARPSIISAPAAVEIGETFPVSFTDSNSISRVTMVKTASVTHSFNMEQRLLELPFTGTGGQLMVQAPTRAAQATPGYYLLFVIDGAGVPSVASMVKVNIAATPNPAVTPALADPGNQAGVVGLAVDLQLVASDPNGDVLGYGASGLPTGLTIHPTSGRITGTPVVPGSYDVVLAASDGINSTSVNLVWTIAPTVVFTLNPPPPTQVALAGAGVTFTVGSMSGVNPRYRWNFDDGTPETAWSADTSVTHTFAMPGIYYVAVTATDDGGAVIGYTVTQVVHLPLTANQPTASANIAFEDRSVASDRVWVVNQDNDSVTVFDATTNAKLAETAVGSAPRSIAVAPNGELWVTNKQSASISVLSPASLAVARTITLPRASQPFGIAFSPTAGLAFVVLEGTGMLLKLDAASYGVTGSVSVGPNPRHVSISQDGATVYVSRFVTPPLPGEGTASVQAGTGGGEVVVVGAAGLTVNNTIVLRHSDKADFENQGSGVPNYLGAATISPDGTQAWVPSKQDNITRGALRRIGTQLNFQNTVRAISSRIDLGSQAEDYAARLDHDNSGVASAVVFDQQGVYMFVALETSREVAVVDAHGQWEMFRVPVGRAPQGLALSADGLKLYVNNFMERTVTVLNLSPLLVDGQASVPVVATLSAVGSEKLSAQVLLGKQLFYDAADGRLARDAYISCAACHNDGGQDGRVWDLTGFGEGLRNTIALRGRAGGQGFLHWSNNFDEVQDFEGQIRNLAGGSGLMSDALFDAGTRRQPLGDAKAGQSANLDALAAYVVSLNAFAASPLRNQDGTLTAAAVAGQAVFLAESCAACHSGTAFTNSNGSNPSNVGTLTSVSGQRLGGVLTGIDVPTLRDVWETGPYLHDGSAATLDAAVRAHSNVTVSDTDLPNLTAYLQQIGSDATSAPAPTPTVPSSLLATAASSAQINLTWVDNASTETAYVVERSTNGATFTTLVTLTANVTSYINTGLTASTPYYYRVLASNGNGASGYSNMATATTSAAATAKPTAPNGLAVTAVSSSRINVTWVDRATNETSYTLQRSKNGTNFSTLATLNANVTSYNNTGLTPSTAYWYRVRAVNGVGSSAYSSKATATTDPEVPTVPAAPTGLVATATSSTQINLTWLDNATTETSYRVESSTNGTVFTALVTLGANVASYSNTGLTASTAYYYRVVAANVTGDSGYSNIATVATSAPPLLPAAPTGLLATAALSTQINLTWVDNANTETSYRVERSADGVTFVPLTTLGPDVTSYSNTGLTATTAYYYRVVAANVTGDSGYSNTATATTSVAEATSNIAGLAAATASSETVGDQQYAIKAVDGIVDGDGGTPGDYTREWVSNGQKVGAWIKLTWPVAYTLDRVILHDRPNTDDQVTGGTLTFSDGTTASVTALDNAGAAKEVTFTPRSVTSVTFTVTKVKSTTQNIGLAEIKVYGQ